MSYRDDLEALQIQLTQLEREHADLLGERSRLLEGARRMPRLVDEIDRLRRQLHARAPRKLPVLDDIRVASPCSARWDEMAGDERSRFCGSCQKNVYNLSAMTREAAEALVRAKEGDLCVRYYRRADGTVLTADCSVGVRRKRVRWVAAAGAVTALAAGAVSLAFVQMGAPVRTIQGGVSPGRPIPPPVTVAEPIGEALQGGISSEVEMGQRVAPMTVRPRMGRPTMRRTP